MNYYQTKLAIIGSRSYSNYEELCEILRIHFSESNTYYNNDKSVNGCFYYFNEIISGCATGADSLGARFAKENNIKLTEFLPDWKNLGKAAGMIRNEKIVSTADFVLCFWDGKSPGSKNSLSLAKKYKKPTMIVYF